MSSRALRAAFVRRRDHRALYRSGRLLACPIRRSRRPRLTRPRRRSRREAPAAVAARGGAGAIPLRRAPRTRTAGDRGGGRADAPATDGEIATAAQDDLSGRPRTPTTVTAGHDVLVSVKGLDAYMNLVPHQEVTVFLEAELKPVYDDSLTNANLSQQAKEPPQRYLLTLSNGEAFQRVPTRVAGELTLRLVQASSPNIDITASRRLKVHAASAVSIDVVNMPEAGRAGVEFQLMVRALDQFGNVDDSFEREVLSTATVRRPAHGAAEIRRSQTARG